MRFWGVIIILFTFYQIEAQEDNSWNGFGIEVNQIAGKVLKHSSKFILPIPALSSATDINFVWQTYGKKDWHQGRNFPLIGLGCTYTDYGIDSVYGLCLGIYTNLQIYLIRRKNFEWTLRIGDGIAYVTKKYQNTPPFDTLNSAISTNINDFGIFMTDVRYHINIHWDVQAGANFTHISNACFSEPNLGINMYGAHFGVRYFPVTSKPELIIKQSTQYYNPWLIEARLSLAYNQVRTYGNPVLPTYGVSLYTGKKWVGKNKFFTGINYAYKESTYAFLKRWGIERGNETSNSWDGAFFAGNEFLVGRVGIVTELGVYYHQTYMRPAPYYEKLGGNFYLLMHDTGLVKEIFIATRLLAHGAVAEYAEFGIGVGF